MMKVRKNMSVSQWRDYVLEGERIWKKMESDINDRALPIHITYALVNSLYKATEEKPENHEELGNFLEMVEYYGVTCDTKRADKHQSRIQWATKSNPMFDLTDLNGWSNGFATNTSIFLTVLVSYLWSLGLHVELIPMNKEFTNKNAGTTLEE